MGAGPQRSQAPIPQLLHQRKSHPEKRSWGGGLRGSREAHCGELYTNNPWATALGGQEVPQACHATKAHKEGFCELSRNPPESRTEGRAGRRSSNAGPAHEVGDLCLENAEAQPGACPS